MTRTEEKLNELRLELAGDTAKMLMPVNGAAHEQKAKLAFLMTVIDIWEKSWGGIKLKDSSGRSLLAKEAVYEQIDTAFKLK